MLKLRGDQMLLQKSWKQLLQRRSADVSRWVHSRRSAPRELDGRKRRREKRGATLEEGENQPVLKSSGNHHLKLTSTLIAKLASIANSRDTDTHQDGVTRRFGSFSRRRSCVVTLGL